MRYRLVRARTRGPLLRTLPRPGLQVADHLSPMGEGEGRHHMVGSQDPRQRWCLLLLMSPQGRKLPARVGEAMHIRATRFKLVSEATLRLRSLALADQSFPGEERDGYGSTPWWEPLLLCGYAGAHAPSDSF